MWEKTFHFSFVELQFQIKYYSFTMFGIITSLLSFILQVMYPLTYENIIYYIKKSQRVKILCMSLHQTGAQEVAGSLCAV